MTARYCTTFMTCIQVVIVLNIGFFNVVKRVRLYCCEQVKAKGWQTNLQERRSEQRQKFTPTPNQEMASLYSTRVFQTVTVQSKSKIVTRPESWPKHTLEPENAAQLMSRRADGIDRQFSPLDSKIDDASGVSVMGTGVNPLHVARRRASKCMLSSEINRRITGIEAVLPPCAKRAIEVTIEELNISLIGMTLSCSPDMTPQLPQEKTNEMTNGTSLLVDTFQIRMVLSKDPDTM